MSHSTFGSRVVARPRVARSVARPAFVLILLGAVVMARVSAMPLDQALALAEARSRELPAQDAAVDAARQMAIAAGHRPDPVLSAGVQNLPVNGADRFSLTDDFMTMRYVGVMQEFTRSDKLAARSSRYEREADAARAARLVALTNLRRDTAIAWLDREYRRRMTELLCRQRDEAALQVQAAEAAYRGGHGAQADVFAARAAVAQLDDRVAAAERDLAVADTMLTRWTGTAVDASPVELPGMDTVPFREQSLDTELDHHPELTLLDKQQQVAQSEADVARTETKSDVSVSLMYSQRGSAYSNMVSIGVSIPLQWNQANRQDREVAAKLALAEQLRAQREEQARMHVAEVRGQLQQWHADRDRLHRYDDQLLPLARDRTQAALAAYRGGTGTLGAVIDARRAELDTRMDQLRLEQDTAREWAQLTFLVPAGHDAGEHQ